MCCLFDLQNEQLLNEVCRPPFITDCCWRLTDSVVTLCYVADDNSMAGPRTCNQLPADVRLKSDEPLGFLRLNCSWQRTTSEAFYSALLMAGLFQQSLQHWRWLFKSCCVVFVAVDRVWEVVQQHLRRLLFHLSLLGEPHESGSAAVTWHQGAAWPSPPQGRLPCGQFTHFRLLYLMSSRLRRLQLGLCQIPNVRYRCIITFH